MSCKTYKTAHEKVVTHNIELSGKKRANNLHGDKWNAKVKRDSFSHQKKLEHILNPVKGRQVLRKHERELRRVHSHADSIGKPAISPVMCTMLMALYMVSGVDGKIRAKENLHNHHRGIFHTKNKHHKELETRKISSYLETFGKQRILEKKPHLLFYPNDNNSYIIAGEPILKFKAKTTIEMISEEDEIVFFGPQKVMNLPKEVATYIGDVKLKNNKNSKTDFQKRLQAITEIDNLHNQDSEILFIVNNIIDSVRSRSFCKFFSGKSEGDHLITQGTGKNIRKKIFHLINDSNDMNQVEVSKIYDEILRSIVGYVKIQDKELNKNILKEKTEKVLKIYNTLLQKKSGKGEKPKTEKEIRAKKQEIINYYTEILDDYDKYYIKGKGGLIGKILMAEEIIAKDPLGVYCKDKSEIDEKIYGKYKGGMPTDEVLITKMLDKVLNGYVVPGLNTKKNIEFIKKNKKTIEDFCEANKDNETNWENFKKKKKSETEQTISFLQRNQQEEIDNQILSKRDYIDFSKTGTLLDNDEKIDNAAKEIKNILIFKKNNTKTLNDNVKKDNNRYYYQDETTTTCKKTENEIVRAIKTDFLKKIKNINDKDSFELYGLSRGIVDCQMYKILEYLKNQEGYKDLFKAMNEHYNLILDLRIESFKKPKEILN